MAQLTVAVRSAWSAVARGNPNLVYARLDLTTTPVRDAQQETEAVPTLLVPGDDAHLVVACTDETRASSWATEWSLRGTSAYRSYQVVTPRGRFFTATDDPVDRPPKPPLLHAKRPAAAQDVFPALLAAVQQYSAPGAMTYVVFPFLLSPDGGAGDLAWLDRVPSDCRILLPVTATALSTLSADMNPWGRCERHDADTYRRTSAAAVDGAWQQRRASEFDAVDAALGLRGASPPPAGVRLMLWARARPRVRVVFCETHAKGREAWWFRTALLGGVRPPPRSYQPALLHVALSGHGVAGAASSAGHARAGGTPGDGTVSLRVDTPGDSTLHVLFVGDGAPPDAVTVRAGGVTTRLPSPTQPMVFCGTSCTCTDPAHAPPHDVRVFGDVCAAASLLAALRRVPPFVRTCRERLDREGRTLPLLDQYARFFADHVAPVSAWLCAHDAGRSGRAYRRSQAARGRWRAHAAQVRVVWSMCESVYAELRAAHTAVGRLSLERQTPVRPDELPPLSRQSSQPLSWQPS